MQNEKTFQSRDFYLSSCIRATGASLIALEPLNHKTFLFVFAISPTQANQIIKKHWNGQLTLPTKDVIDAINELKTRLRQGI